MDMKNIPPHDYLGQANMYMQNFGQNMVYENAHPDQLIFEIPAVTYEELEQTFKTYKAAFPQVTKGKRESFKNQRDKHMTRFIHIRETEQVVRYSSESHDSTNYYIDKFSNKGGLTVAFQRNGKYVRFGAAKCSKKDNFSRKVGRLLSEYRLLTEPATLCVDPRLDDHEVEELLRGKFS